MAIGTTSNMEWLSGPGGSGDVEYTAGHGIVIDNYDHIISTDQSVVQDKLTAGENITIQNNVISATPQRQADWNQSDSTAADYIRNKPTIPSGDELVPVATPSDEDKVLTVDSNGNPVWANSHVTPQVQSDWAQTDSTAVDYIQNKPQNLVQDASYVHTDNNFTDADKAKLTGVEAGAEANVQSDWNQANSSADDYIKNKPTIPSGSQLVPSATSSDEDKVLTVDSNGDPVWAAAQGGVQVQSDWTETDTTDVSFIQNKPTTKPIAAGNGISVVEYADNVTITNTAAQVQSDWAESTSTEPDYIKNKPTVKQIVAGANVTINESNSQITISSTGAGGVPVQANWTQADSSQPDYIKNKPTIPLAQVQSNWTETNTGSKAFVLNKPATKPIVAGNGIVITETATEIIISLA